MCNRSFPLIAVIRRLLFVVMFFGCVRVAVCQSQPLVDTASDQMVTDSEDLQITSGEALLLKLRQGGLTVVVLLFVSVIGVATTLERIVHLRLSRIAPKEVAGLFEKLCCEGRFDELEAAATKSKSTLGRLVSAMVRHRESGMEELSTLAGDMASREMKLHLLRAYPLMICATLSPLLGLFGTVVGMISAFDKVAAAGSLGDASMLGGDISKALITTAAGLVVAIPALALYHFFRSRTNLLVIVLEERISELFYQWQASDSLVSGRDCGGKK